MKDLRLAEALAFMKKNLQAARLAGVTALVVALSAWTSCTAAGIANRAEAGIREAVAIRETAARFSTQFMPASAAESDEWGRTTIEAAAFGSPEPSRLSLAQTVSRIAEVAGLSGARASFTPSDSVGFADARMLGDLAFNPAAYGLRLDGSGGVGAVARVILRLPPATEITALSLSGDGSLRATFHLAVYEPGGGPQN